MRRALAATILGAPALAGCARPVVMKRAAWIGVAACAGLSACAPMKTVTLEVREGDGPGRGALVRAIPLDEGFVPLPLNDQTLQEILLTGKKRQQAVVGDDGMARLRLRAGKPHLVEVRAPAWRGKEQEAWLLESDASVVEPASEGDARYTLRVAP
ncbi:MAG: hypothetical protein IBJ10_05810 [Phycisphaerales bacterium]|nr:hypothetical protein [Phycisphaerales bacterium]